MFQHLIESIRVACQSQNPTQKWAEAEAKEGAATKEEAEGVEVIDEPKPSELNTNVQRAIDAIYLRPVTNGHEVYNLATQSVITSPLNPLSLADELLNYR